MRSLDIPTRLLKRSIEFVLSDKTSHCRNTPKDLSIFDIGGI